MTPRWGTHRHAAPPHVRAAVLQRDGNQCTFVTEGTRCTAPATEVHHVDEHSDGGADDDNNLVSLCAWHHRKLTAQHAHARRWRVSVRRETPRHPGLR